ALGGLAIFISTPVGTIVERIAMTLLLAGTACALLALVVGGLMSIWSASDGEPLARRITSFLEILLAIVAGIGLLCLLVFMLVNYVNPIVEHWAKPFVDRISPWLNVAIAIPFVLVGAALALIVLVGIWAHIVTAFKPLLMATSRLLFPPQLRGPFKGNLLD